MDPFALQQAARKRTVLFIALAVAAVVAIAVVAGYVFSLTAWAFWRAVSLTLTPPYS